MRVTYSANNKSQIQFKLRISQEKEQIKTAQKIVMDKKLRETNYLCGEITNSKRQVRRNLATCCKFVFAVWRKRDAYHL